MNTTEGKNKQLARQSLRRLYKRPGALLITVCIILIGAVLAIMFALPTGERINQSGYQVVYTTNGAAYFGKLKNTSGDYLTLETPYTAQDVAVPNQDDKAANKNNQTTLLKVRDQVYGPEDVISIKSDQVLFWQNLRSDSKVAQAIKNKQ